MNYFEQILEDELKVQRKRLADANKVLARIQNGYLRVRRRKRVISIYQVFTENGTQREKNITNDSKAIRKFIRKRVQVETSLIAQKNIFALESLSAVYKNSELESVLNGLNETYKDALKVLNELDKHESRSDYPHQRFNAQRHIHETVAGFKVRSKSEVIIANALVNYGIPFHYEELFPYRKADGNRAYPDFTFLLPNGEKIIWEHFGMLDDPGYAISCGERLALLQKHGYILYKNLIITVDDNQGNCSSALIDEIIRKNLLPYFN